MTLAPPPEYVFSYLHLTERSTTRGKPEERLVRFSSITSPHVPVSVAHHLETQSKKAKDARKGKGAVCKAQLRPGRTERGGPNVRPKR